jgi:hypothetical protein
MFKWLDTTFKDQEIIFIKCFSLLITWARVLRSSNAWFIPVLLNMDTFSDLAQDQKSDYTHQGRSHGVYYCNCYNISKYVCKYSYLLMH